MTTSTFDNARPLRLWPAVILAAVQCLGWFVIPIALPDQEIFGVLGGVAAALGIIIWWLFFSRARWSDRFGALIVMIAAIILTSRLIHISIAGAGMGNLFYILSVASMTLALVLGAVLGRQLNEQTRRLVMAALIMVGCGVWLLVRTDGIMGAGGFQFAWRWSATAEERLLAHPDVEPKAVPSPLSSPLPALPEASKETPAVAADEKRAGQALAALAPIDAYFPAAEWPGFRGPNRDGIVHGVQIQTDWSASPPVQIWRRAIGPGWSSFAVQGDILYTQEQRGEDEIVACYHLSTGQPVWRHRDAVRFWESNAGAGPRGTPTISNGRVYAFGATGMLNALDARTGRVLWSRNAAADTKTEVPTWGFSSSPLVIDDVVIVATSGTLAGYDIADGKPRWIGKESGMSYSSPHLVTIDGARQAIFLTGAATTSVNPADGKILWQHAWEGGAIVQPAVISDSDILINSIGWTGGAGTRRLSVKHGPEGWNVEERWTSNGLKPYFNDFVVHKGNAYGFDGEILASIDLTDGKRKWKGGRYGSGQLILLADQDLLLVLSELGELALVNATPDKFTEVARIPAIEGKTWNHPVLVGDVLLVRNGEEMAAFRLARAR